MSDAPASESDFAALLKWHMDRGTRPNGKSRKWRVADMATALSRDEKTVRNWRNGKVVPDDCDPIADAFFGDGNLNEALRLKFLHAHEASRKRGKSAIADQPTARNEAPTPFNIPVSEPRHFIGREAELGGIEAALKNSSGRVAISALHGMRGVGKSTLAAVYGHRRKTDYRAVWWIRAQGEETARADLAGLAVVLGWAAKDAPELKAAQTALSRLADDGKDCLLIYDNAIDAAQLHPLLPAGGAAHILITSNSPAWGSVADPLQIDLWPVAAGADFLEARAARKGEREAAEALSSALGGLPLAHEQAAAWCEQLGAGFAEYLRRFKVEPTTMLDHAASAPADYQGGTTVAKTFALAIEAAAKRSPAAEPLLTLCALLPAEPIPFFLFEEGREELTWPSPPLSTLLAGDGLDDAIAALRAFSLINREAVPDERDKSFTTDCVRLHRLVREIAAARVTDRQTAEAALLSAIIKLYPKDSYNNPVAWQRCRRLYVHVMALIIEENPNNKIQEPRSSSLILFHLGMFRHSALADYSQAKSLCARAFTIAEMTLGPDHPSLATWLNNFGVLLSDAGDFAAARPLIERALKIDEKAYGPNHPEVAANLNNLAILLTKTGEFEVARPLLERAIAISKNSLGPDHPDLATSLGNFASLLAKTGEFGAARPLSERALRIDERALGDNHPSTNIRRGNLAKLTLAEGKPQTALSLIELALKHHVIVLGADHPTTKTSAFILAAVLDALDRSDEAEAIRMKYVLGAPPHPENPPA